MDPLLVFAASDLDDGGLPVDRELPPAWLAEQLADAEATVARPGRVQGRLSRSAGEVVVRGVATAEVKLPCARCLEPATVELRGELSLLLRPGAVLEPPARQVPGAGDAAAPGPRGPGARARQGVELARAGRAVAGARPPRAGRAATSRPAEGSGARGREGKLPEYEFSADEADHDLYDGETVVLDPFVREALLLEIPNFPLCSEDCPGMPRVPAPAGADPALAPSAVAEGDRAPGTRSLGDALRAALAERDARGKPKKR